MGIYDVRDADERCTAGLLLKGEHFRCDLNADHRGWAHSSRAAEALWRDIDPEQVTR